MVQVRILAAEQQVSQGTRDHAPRLTAMGDSNAPLPGRVVVEPVEGSPLRVEAHARMDPERQEQAHTGVPQGVQWDLPDAEVVDERDSHGREVPRSDSSKNLIEGPAA
jgi:hypothetical protein